MANAAGPAVAIGYAVGRIGCLLSGDGDYGSPTKSFIGIAFPHGTVPTPPGVKVWPTPPMETIAMLLVCWLLYRMAKKPQPGWYVWGWFMVLAGVERFLIEFIRRNPVVFAGLRTTQWESIASVVIGIAIILIVRDREPVEASLGGALTASGAASGAALAEPAPRQGRRSGRPRPSPPPRRPARAACTPERLTNRRKAEGAGSARRSRLGVGGGPSGLSPSGLGRQGHQQQWAGGFVEQPAHEQRAARARTRRPRPRRSDRPAGAPPLR